MANLLSRIPAAARLLWGGASQHPYQKKQQRGFAAARTTNTTQGWLTVNNHINNELRTDLNKLRTRARDLVKDNDYARKFAGMVCNNIVGPNGFVLQARVEDKPGVADNLANKAIESAWRTWSKSCDVAGRQSFKDFCETLVRGMPCDGEFLVRIVVGADARNDYNFALQALDVARLDTQYNRAATGAGNTPNTHAIVMGVEVDPYRRPVAYHLFTSVADTSYGAGRTRERIPADQIIHCYKTDFAEQLRGIPWMSAGLLSLHHLGAFQLSALVAAEHGAKQLGFFVTADGENQLAGDAVLPAIDTVQDLQYDTLPAGTTVEVPDSRYPNDVFAPFCDAALRRTASGFGVAFHSLANNLENVNFSSVRSGTLEERDRWMSDQTWFVDSFLEKIYPVWLKTALLSGAIAMPNGSPLPAAKYSKFVAHVWQPRRWEWVDPYNDMQAKVLGVGAGLLTPQAIITQMGQGDPSDVLGEIAAFQQLATSMGVKLPAYDSKPGANSDKKTTTTTVDPAP